MLWAMSDVLLLEQVHLRYPDILSDEEWASIAENGEMYLNGDDHYAASVNHNYDFTEEKTRWEWTALTSSLRWRAVKELLKPDTNPSRVMDFGTHTGAHAVDMSNWFPNTRVFAREIVLDIIPAIEFTIKNYAKNPGQINYDIGDHRNPPLPKDLDLLYAGEVYEHMYNWRGFITALENACRPGGQLILTVPNGPWEVNGTRHIHVAEWRVDDLMEVFGTRPGFKTLEILNRVPGGFPQGWVLFTWEATPGEPFGEVNWDRKLAQWGF